MFNTIDPEKIRISKKETGKRLAHFRRQHWINKSYICSCLRISEDKYDSIEKGLYSGNIVNYFYYCFRIANILQIEPSYLFLSNSFRSNDFELFLENTSRCSKKIMADKMMSYFQLID